MKSHSSFLRYGLSLGVALSTVAAIAAGPCVEVDAPGTVQLPDGRKFEARTVQLCQAGPFTPSTSILEVRIDGIAVGRYMAEIRGDSRLEVPGTSFVTFDRLGADQPYHLASVTVLRGGRSESHRLWRNPGWQIASRRGRLAPAPDRDPEVEAVVLAARVP